MPDPKDVAIINGLSTLKAEWLDRRDGVSGRTPTDTNAADGLDAPYTWVRLSDGRAAVPCINKKFRRNACQVRVYTAIRAMTGQREITDIHEDTYTSLPPQVVEGIQSPSSGLVESEYYLPGRVEPADGGGLTVYIRELPYYDDIWVGGTHSLSTEVGALSSGASAMLIVGIDTATNTIDVTVGTEHTLVYTYSLSDVTAISLGTGILPLWALVIKDGQTSISDCWSSPKRQFDIRPPFTVPAAVATIDAEDVTYTPTTSGDWLTPPDEAEEAFDELAGRVQAIEDAGGGGIGDYVLITDQKTQNTAGGTFTSGADRTRDLNTKVDAAEVASILKLAFTSGGTYEVLVGDTITGASSSVTAEVFDVELTSGTWAGGDAAGNLWLNNQSGTFSAENLDVGANTNVATIAADSTTNQVRLSAGTWRLNAKAPAHRVTRHQAWWQNVTDASRVLLGTSEYAPNAIDATVTSSFLRGRFTIASKKTFELQHRCATTMATNGYGVEANFNAEVYSVVELVRE